MLDLLSLFSIAVNCDCNIGDALLLVVLSGAVCGEVNLCPDAVISMVCGDAGGGVRWRVPVGVGLCTVICPP